MKTEKKEKTLYGESVSDGASAAEILRSFADEIHTTPAGKDRIIKNLGLTCEEPVSYCKKLIFADDCVIMRRGKNYYCTINGATVTVNAYSYTIITAHIDK